MKCDYCEEEATSNIQTRTGTWHPSQDQRDSSRVTIIHLCDDHWSEVENLLARFEIKAA